MKFNLKQRKIVSLVLVIAIILGIPTVVYAAEREEYINEDVACIVEEALNNPETVSFDDVVYAMQQDDHAAEVILGYFSEVAESLDVPSSEDDSVMKIEEHTTNDEKCYIGSYEYDLETGEERYIREYFDSTIDDGKVHQVEPMFIENTESDLKTDEGAVARGYETEILFPQNDSKLKTIYKLFIRRQKDGKMFWGSAFALSDKALGTAGHCLRSNNKESLNGWAGSILCVPAYRIDNNGTEVHPYGESYQVANKMWCDELWRDNSDYDYDYGILQLKDPIPVGYMGLREVPDNTNIINKKVYFAGYPGKKENMYRMYSTVGGYTNCLISVSQKSYEGQSGGPLWDTDGYIIGIISRGDDNTTHCIKFNKRVYDKMVSYR